MLFKEDCEYACRGGLKVSFLGAEYISGVS